MVKNYWYAIYRSELLKKKPTRVQRFGINLVLWRDSSGSVVCLEDRCPHRGTSLGLGKVVQDCIECPYHGFQFNSEGACTLIPSNGCQSEVPANVRVQNFKIYEAKGIIWLWWGKPMGIYPQLPWFDEYEENAPYVEMSMETEVSFCRGMEANLDFGHFYFVHKIFRMPGMGPVADPFESTLNGDLIQVHGTLRHEKKNGLTPSGVPFTGSVLFPGIASYDAPGRKEKKDRTFVALSPIDENRSWVLFRVYYSTGFWTPLKRFYWKFIFLKFLFPILHRQDLRLFKEQTPRSSGLHTDLLVSKADKGIAQYLTLWREAMKREKMDLAKESEASQQNLNCFIS